MHHRVGSKRAVGIGWEGEGIGRRDTEKMAAGTVGGGMVGLRKEGSVEEEEEGRQKTEEE